ncbi:MULTISPECIES: hypothetical protein [unclassified Microbacterium]|uniref:hypothetical protein n=1 Tax=unclassified Microbacterium TaxID=2609290 RepID=UPI00214C3AB2|nr:MULTISPECIES: hypothetical protein [unclassified Microbacterium]MCR2811123.1 hypothetical protein [Microbacterium sp. zg.B185]WIM20763.1 hypothetical protein QNO12_08265 [Microbacterium sp. zg-B185]
MEPAKTLRYRLGREPFWWLGAGVVIGVVGAGLGTLLASKTSEPWSDLWSDVAGAGVGVVAVGMVGGALAFSWRAIEKRREEEAFVKDKLRAEFTELIVLYNGVKSVRRALRALGLDAKLHLDPERVKKNMAADERYYEPESCQGVKELEVVGRAVELTREQVVGFQEQMGRLNELQLGYEAKKRQFDQADLLGEDRATVVAKFEDIESWLNRLVGLWEARGWDIREGTKLVEVSPCIQPLVRRLHFRHYFTRPMQDITDVFNSHLFGAPRTRARRSVRRP